MYNFQQFFGFVKEPFAQNIAPAELYALPGLDGFVQRFEYCLKLKAVSILTGDIGCGKSTSLRYAAERCHTAEYRILSVTAYEGTAREFLKQIAYACGILEPAGSLTALARTICSVITELTGRRQIPLLIIDEAHLLMPGVFAHLHTLLQFEFDSQPRMPVVLCGNDLLIDKLLAPFGRALASRIVGRTHLEALTLKTMDAYLAHHCGIAGISERLFSEQAVVAVHQGSGGFLRKANLLARGALIAAASAGVRVVDPEHVRLSASELL